MMSIFVLQGAKFYDDAKTAKRWIEYMTKPDKQEQTFNIRCREESMCL